MADYNLGTAHGTVKIDSDTKGVDQAQKKLGTLDKSASKSGMSMSEIGNKTGIAGVAIAGGLGVAINSAANFEKGLSAINAVSGATPKQMDAISDAALRIGKDTSFSATEAASAIEELAKAGIPIEDILNGAADATVNLAAAGEVALPEAATIASNAMNQFNLTADDMTGVVDAIAQTANASAIDVSDFGMSLSQVGAMANLVGFSFEDTASAIGQLGDAGIKGSDAGTSLKTMLGNLQPTTEAQIATMTELGLVTEDGANKFFDAQGHVKSLREVQDLLNTSTKGLSDAEKTMALETIFGSDAIRAAAILADGGAASYDNFAEKQAGVGSAAEVAKKRMDNLKGSWEQLKGSAETLGIQLGTVLLPAVRGIVDGANALVGAFLSLSSGQQKALVAALAFVGGALLLGSALIKIVGFAKSLHSAFVTLRIVSTATQASWVATAAKAVASWTMMALRAVASALQVAAAWAASVARTVASFVVMSAQAVANSARMAAAWVAAAARTVASFALMAAQAAMNAARVAAAWVVSTGAAAARAVAQMAIAVASVVAGWVLMGVQAMARAVMMAAAWLVAMGPVGWVIAVVVGLVALIIANWDKVKQWTSAAWNFVSTSVANAWRAVVGAVSAGVSNVISYVSRIPGNIKSFFASAGSWLLSAGADIVQGLWNGISGAAGWLMDQISGFVGNVIGNVKSFFGIGSPSKVFAGIGVGLSQGLAGGLKDSANLPVRAAGAVASRVVGAMQTGMSLASLGGSSPTIGGNAGTANAGSRPITRNGLSNARALMGGDRPVQVELNTFNPVAERASDSEARRIRAVSALGPFGG